MKRKALLLISFAFLLIFFAGCSINKDTAMSEQKDATPNENKNMENETANNSMANGNMDIEENGSMEENDVMLKYTDISPQQAKKMIDENPDLIVIDVSPKYDEGHLPRAINYYVGDGSLDEAIPGLDKDAEYLVYCHVDSASILGSQKLVDAGFENVYRLEGNYSAWVNAGYPVEK